MSSEHADNQHGRSVHDHTIAPRRLSCIIPRLPLEPSTCPSAAGSQELQAANMTRNVLSPLDDESYEEIESIEAQTDEEASTVSVEDSVIGGDSNADTLSDFAYDSDGGDEPDGQALDSTIVDFPEPTPIVQSQPEINDRLSYSNLFISTHTDATERWELDDTGMESFSPTTSAFFQAWRNEWLEVKHRLKSSPLVQSMIRSFEASFDAGHLMGYVSAIIVAGLVAAVMRNALYGVITTNVQSPAVVNADATQATRESLQPEQAKSPLPQHNDGKAKSWKFEPLQHTKEMLNKLTASRTDAAYPHDRKFASSDKTNTGKHAISNRLPTPMSMPNMKELSHRFPSAIQKHLLREYAYVWLRNGTMIKSQDTNKPPHAGMLGPLTLIKGSKANFMVHYDKEESKIRIVRTERSAKDAPAHIIVSSEGKVVQRGRFDAQNLLYWSPSIVPPSHRHGKLRVVFIQLPLASIQESYVDLGPLPVVASSVTTEEASPIVMKNYGEKLKDALRSYLDAYNWRAQLNMASPYIEHIKLSSKVVLRRAQRRVQLITNKLQALEKEVDDDFAALLAEINMDKIHAYNVEFRKRAKLAQRRSKHLWSILEHRLASLQSLLDMSRIKKIQTSTIGDWKKRLGLA